MNDAKEEIRARLPVEDVVGQYVELKRAGRNLKGRSPWGVDKTPSFMVSPEKGIWHDFSANKGGDIFTFVMEVEGISFREAMEKLAAQAGVELTRYNGGDERVARRKVRAREALELACKYYQFCLSKNKSVCEYVFYKRNMNRQTVEKFRIGYAPRDGKVLTELLKKRGFTVDEMNDAGLLNRFGGDIFRGRMTVPFIEGDKVIGFTARVLDKSEPKYLNTPETLLFNKSRFVFGLAQAKEAIRKNGYVVIVEGNMDVISSHQAGVCEAVATSGTAMTEQHLKILSRLTGDIRLAYDGDDAGVRATERAIMLAGALGINLSVISDYHGAKDPDELIQKDPMLWQQAVENKMSAVDWLLGKYEEKLNLRTGEGKQQYAEVAMRLVGYLHSKVQQKHYKQKIARKLDVEVEDLDAAGVVETRRRYLKKPQTEAENDVMRGLVDRLLALMIYGGVEVAADLETPDDDAKLGELELIYNASYDGWEEDALLREVSELLVRRDEMMKRQKLAELQAKIAETEDEEEQLRLMGQMTDLQKN